MTLTKTTTLLLATALPLLGAAAPYASAPAPAANAKTISRKARIERGAYLVRTMGCHDCHTPWTDGPDGPGPDMSRALTGHPADLVMPVPPAPTAPWGWTAAATNTAFAGPWGISFTANLTPDRETGLGKWTEEIFIATMRTGRHEGKGRPLLPPMPYPALAALTDEDIRSLFAYLQSLPPVRNRVPAPVDPPEEGR
jgi:cytochrome c553